MAHILSLLKCCGKIKLCVFSRKKNINNWAMVLSAWNFLSTYPTVWCRGILEKNNEK